MRFIWLLICFTFCVQSVSAIVAPDTVAIMDPTDLTVVVHPVVRTTLVPARRSFVGPFRPRPCLKNEYHFKYEHPT